ncbi:hypothetical protein [Pseudonocardia lacus]|uniref:hypothetical protein n=1 Tax=Pseudonocardia lacus TaxID=2835865 RepID=UPI001BDC0A6C|nr:hypothetical protein [Pseudonocardia lacus]
MQPTDRFALIAVTSQGGVVHLVSDAVIATCDAGRYVAACGATFIPAAMTEPDGTDDCPLCRARQPQLPQARGQRR